MKNLIAEQQLNEGRIFVYYHESSENYFVGYMKEEESYTKVRGYFHRNNPVGKLDWFNSSANEDTVLVHFHPHKVVNGLSYEEIVTIINNKEWNEEQIQQAQSFDKLTENEKVEYFKNF